MRIDEIIKEKRKDQGLTQEQVADYLGVSTPAVNKWEKGISYPDITILPALARLLRVDLNTLLSFKDDLTDIEIGHFINDLVEIIRSKGFNIGFEKAMDKIHEYPNCDKLILNIATVLEGSLFMFAVENIEYYESDIEKLYVKASNSKDIEVANQATSMLINKYLGREEYEKAQACIDKLPNITYDKKQLQGNLYIKASEFDKASELFENKLITNGTEIFTTLSSMMEIALRENRNEDAKYFAEVIEKTIELFDFWDYNSYAAYFHLYSVQKDADNLIPILDKMLTSIRKKWDISKSKLYKHIKPKEYKDESSEIFFSTFLNALKNDKDNELEFLKDNERFLNILDRHSN
ncbi:helix-turn-helix domain-containing protein [Clostridium tertium]|uniref:Transcriptional repressor DicA n=1 Tax=Clostridium tertium TaxID=1559 RepID=A0A6N2Y6K1_9CLOT